MAKVVKKYGKRGYIIIDYHGGRWKKELWIKHIDEDGMVESFYLADKTIEAMVLGVVEAIRKDNKERQLRDIHSET